MLYAHSELHGIVASHSSLLHLSIFHPRHIITHRAFFFSCCLHFFCLIQNWITLKHYDDIIMGAMASQITSLMIVFLNRLFRRGSIKTSKLRVTGLCAGNSPRTGEFPAQMASNAENISISWRHHEMITVKQEVTVVSQWYYTYSQHNVFARTLYWYFVTCLWN